MGSEVIGLASRQKVMHKALNKNHQFLVLMGENGMVNKNNK